MDNFNNLSHSQMHKMYEAARKTNQERATIGSKRRLMEFVEKKFQTAIIGALARCEEYLGELWGHGLDDSELTNEQLDFKENIWENLRKDILDYGNSQLRNALDEMDTYTISWNKYKTDFIIKN